jgi:hypothetical protein
MKKLLLISILSSLICCQKEDSVIYREEIVDIIDAKLPDSLKIGDEVNYKVFFKYKNGCGRFKRNDIVQENKSFVVTTFAVYPDNSTCSGNTPLDSSYINFAPQQSGTFIFSFHSTGGFITDSVIVY